MNEWRIIDLTVNDAYMNMAIDEAILKITSQDKVPNTLRLYRWKPSAVSIGYFQSINDEVNVNRCKSLGIDIVRRITGGGAVYHDYEGEVTYSLILKEDEKIVPKDILRSYRLICTGVLYALKDLGLDAEFKEVNDILVDKRKISGNAQTRRQGVVLQHGTILVDLNIARMFDVLRVGPEKISDKAIKSVEERVTSIHRELKTTISFDKVASSLKKGFQEALNMTARISELSSKEIQIAESLRRSKYMTKNWVYKR